MYAESLVHLNRNNISSGSMLRKALLIVAVLSQSMQQSMAQQCIGRGLGADGVCPYRMSCVDEQCEPITNNRRRLGMDYEPWKGVKFTKTGEDGKKKPLFTWIYPELTIIIFLLCCLCGCIPCFFVRL